MKLLMVKLEYGLPGITIGASGARQPVNIRIEIEIKYRSARRLRNKSTHKKKWKKKRNKVMVFLCYEGSLNLSEQREMFRKWGAKQTKTQTQAIGNRPNIWSKVQADAYCPSSKKIFSLSILSKISQTEYERLPQNSERNFKDWPLYSSRSLEYIECGFFTLLFCDLL